MPGDYEKNAITKTHIQPIKIERSLEYNTKILLEFNILEIKRIKAARSSFK